MQHFHICTRRGFLERSTKLGLGVALSTLADIPFVVKQALAEGSIGANGKKVLFIFLRGANDALNSVIPVLDSAYSTDINPVTSTPYRPPAAGNIGIPADAIDYSTPGGCFDATQYMDAGGTARGAADATFAYSKAIRLGNGFAALHPSLKFLAPLYNAGELALIHRVGYPKQSRSHFDSQNYWENGAPGSNVIKDGIFYRAMIESGLAHSSPLTGVSVQSALPLLLRGSAAAMTNLTDPTRYNLLGIPNNTAAGNAKYDSALTAASDYPVADKRSRELLGLQYGNLARTLSIFETIDFTEGNGSTTGNFYKDDIVTDSDAPYHLFPTSNSKNGGYAAHGNDTNKYVVDTKAYPFFTNLKAAALILNKTDAIVAGTELTGFDTHQTQGGVTGTHANLMRRVGWALYALRQYFTRYGRGNNPPSASAKVNWNDIVVVTLSEFGRTTAQNNSSGTDHAEAGVMMVAGGAVQGYGRAGRTSGVFGCHPGEFTGARSNLNWVTGPANQSCGTGCVFDGSMFGVGDRYLKRIVDYRSVLGEIIRAHLGATQAQLNRIIPGYGVTGERLLDGGTSSVDSTPILGEVGLL